MYVNLNKRLPKGFKVPTEQDVQNAVEEVLREIRGEAPVVHHKPVTITKTGKARKPRQPKASSNTFRSDFNHIYQYSNMLSHVEDIFMGAIRQNTTGNILNKYMVFNLLKSLDVISTENVFMMVNSNRPKPEHISERYAQQLASACRNVISAFEHHLDVENITNYVVEDAIDDDFDIETDAEGYRNHVQPLQTSEQKRALLVEAGLTPSQVEAHMNGDKVMWGVDIRCKSGSSVGVQSAYVHVDIYPESYENMKWLPALCCYVDVTTGEMYTYS